MLSLIRRLVGGRQEEEMPARSDLLSYGVWREVYCRLRIPYDDLADMFSSPIARNSNNWIIPVLDKRRFDLESLRAFQHAFDQLGRTLNLDHVVRGGELIPLDHDRDSSSEPYFVEVYRTERLETNVSIDQCAAKGIQPTTIVEELLFNLAFLLKSNRFPHVGLATTVCAGTRVRPGSAGERLQVAALHVEGDRLVTIRRFRTSVVTGSSFGIRRTILEM